jgi:hypothetical protein
MRNEYKILVRKTEGRKPARREGADWIHLAQDRDQWWVLLNTAMILRDP